MKRNLLTVLAMVLTLFALAACDITSTTSTTQAPTSTTTTSVSSDETTATTTTLTSTDSTSTTTTSDTTTTTTTTTTTQVTTTIRTFTLAELAVYNGNGGSTAYIAIDGIVYDVTNADGWTNGWHEGHHYAGTDCTAAFEGSPHNSSILNQLPIVGELGN